LVSTQVAVLLPEAFATPSLVSPYWIRYLLSHPRCLGEKYELNDVVLHLAEPGAAVTAFAPKDPFSRRLFPWYPPDAARYRYPFGETSLAVNGVAGHDLPPSAVTVAHPATAGFRALEFCVGSSALGGARGGGTALANATLAARYAAAYGPVPGAVDCAATAARRVDALGFGDVAVFDSQVVFRHGANGGAANAAALFATYSRHWYKDASFAAPRDGAAAAADADAGARATYDRAVRGARFGVPDADWAAVGPGIREPVARMSSPLFDRDPSDDEQREYGGDDERSACAGDKYIEDDGAAWTPRAPAAS